MDKLEKFISENRGSFDDAEPLSGHFSRFEESWISSNPAEGCHRPEFPMKIAAGLLFC